MSGLITEGCEPLDPALDELCMHRVKVRRTLSPWWLLVAAASGLRFLKRGSQRTLMAWLQGIAFRLLPTSGLSTSQ